MIEYEWSQRSEIIIKLSDINVYQTKTVDSVVVLPNDNKIVEAMDIIVSKYKLCVEYLHWDNKWQTGWFHRPQEQYVCTKR